MRISNFTNHLKSFFQIPTAPRLLLFFPAILLKLVSAAFSSVAYILHNGPLAITGMAFWILWIASLFLIALPQTDRLLARTTRWLKPLSITLLAVLLMAGLFEFAAVEAADALASLPGFAGNETAQLLQQQRASLTYNDATVLCHQAIDNLLDGKNPYAEANIITATLRFNADSIPWDKTTPVRTGRFASAFPYPSEEELKAVWEEAALTPQIIPPEMESKLNYPAGCFLLGAPFVRLGITDLRWIYLLAMLGGLAFAVVKASTGMRWWLLGAALASLEVWQSIASGETGVMIFPLLLMAWFFWRRKLWCSAICMGLAVATKQVAWFFLPFYLLLIFRNTGWKQAAGALAVVGGIFAIFNVAFIVQNPGLWLSSVLAPVTDKFFPMGVGPVSLVVSGYIGTRSEMVFTLMEITAFVAALAWYWRHCRRYPHTGIILAVVPLFFAWRSSWWYFFYFDIMLLAIVIIEDYAKRPPAEKPVAGMSA